MVKKHSKSKTEDPKKRANVSLDSMACSASVIQGYTQIFGELDIIDLIDSLGTKHKQLRKGDLEEIEKMLFDQAHVLQAIFSRLARVAIQSDFIQHVDIYLRLALKAQGQCTRTLATLHVMKCPSTISFIKQTNIGENVQVNNSSVGAQDSQEKISNSSNKLLEVCNDPRLDLRTTNEAICPYPHLETIR
jgi:hypothetical protein